MKMKRRMVRSSRYRQSAGFDKYICRDRAKSATHANAARRAAVALAPWLHLVLAYLVYPHLVAQRATPPHLVHQRGTLQTSPVPPDFATLARPLGLTRPRETPRAAQATRPFVGEMTRVQKVIDNR